MDELLKKYLYRKLAVNPDLSADVLAQCLRSNRIARFITPVEVARLLKTSQFIDWVTNIRQLKKHSVKKKQTEQKNNIK